MTLKITLEENIKELQMANERLHNELNIMREQLDFYKKHSAPGIHSSMTIALERMADALARTVDAIGRRRV